jgi:hypothetical protein
MDAAENAGAGDGGPPTLNLQNVSDAAASNPL